MGYYFNKFNSADGYEIDDPVIQPQDLISNPLLLNAAYRKKLIRSKTLKTNQPLPGITLEDMKEIDIDQLYLYNDYTGIYNFLTAQLFQPPDAAKNIPSKVYGCRVKVINDNLPEVESVPDDKKRKVIDMHTMCIIDETEMSEYTRLTEGTIVYVQLLDQRGKYGKIVHAQNYSTGMAYTLSGQKADNFPGLTGIVGSGVGAPGGNLTIGPRDNPLALKADLNAAEGENMESQGYYNAYKRGQYIGKVKIVIVDGKKVREVMVEPLAQMRAAAEQDGIKLTFSSAFRTSAEQARLQSSRGDLAAEVNRSNHQNGTAIDFNVSCCPTHYDWLEANASRFKFVRTVRREPWHWEYVP